MTMHAHPFPTNMLYNTFQTHPCSCTGVATPQTRHLCFWPGLMSWTAAGSSKAKSALQHTAQTHIACYLLCYMFMRCVSSSSSGHRWQQLAGTSMAATRAAAPAYLQTLHFAFKHERHVHNVYTLHGVIRHMVKCMLTAAITTAGSTMAATPAAAGEKQWLSLTYGHCILLWVQRIEPQECNSPAKTQPHGTGM